MPIFVSCRLCGTVVKRKPHEVNGDNYCSRSCLHKGQHGSKNPHWKGGSIKKSCGICGTDFFVCIARDNKAKFCSPKCRQIGNGRHPHPGNRKPKSSDPSPLALITLAPLFEKFKRVPVVRVNPTLTMAIKEPEAPKASKVLKVPKVLKVRRVPKQKKYCMYCNRQMRNKFTGKHFGPACMLCRKLHPRVTVVSCLKCGNQKIYPTSSPDANRQYCRKCRPITGENNPNWRGGITKPNAVLRASAEYKQWRIAVFERDKYIFERDKYTCQKCGQVGWTLHAHHVKSFADHPELRIDISNGLTLCEKCHNETDSWLSNYKRSNKSTSAADRFRYRSEKNLIAYMERVMKSWLKGVNFYRCYCGIWFESLNTRRRCLECHRKKSREAYFRKYPPGSRLGMQKKEAPCGVADCHRQSVVRGYCSMHYTRVKRHGDPTIKKKTGHAMTPERRTAHSVAMKGKIFTEQHKEKISEAVKRAHAARPGFNRKGIADLMKYAGPGENK